MQLGTTGDKEHSVEVIGGFLRDRLKNNGIGKSTGFDTIDRGAKYRISGASETRERKEHAIQGPSTTLLHPMRGTT